MVVVRVTYWLGFRTQLSQQIYLTIDVSKLRKVRSDVSKAEKDIGF